MTEEDKHWFTALLDTKLGQQLDVKLGQFEVRIDSKSAHLETSLEARMLEAMRDLQTELLRRFEAFSSSQLIRVRKLEADQSNLNTGLSGRMDVIDRRLLQIELRLGGAA